MMEGRSLKAIFSKIFLANEDTNLQNKKKQRKLAYLIGFGFIALITFIFISSEPEKEEPQEKTEPIFEIDNLSKGVSYEDKWLKGAKGEVDGVKQRQDIQEKKYQELNELIEQNQANKEEIEQILKIYKEKLVEELDKKLQEYSQTTAKGGIEQADTGSLGYVKVKKKVSYKFGKYIPAGSHVKAVLISGVDAGVGITSEADPRHVLMRVTGSVTSAGFGANPMKSNVLIGCVIQAQAVGDLSSEKAYVKPTLMTCAKRPDTVIELPVKGYVISQGKSGIRGQMISREGDLVLKSFLSGAIAGLGNGVSKSLEPGFSISNAGSALKEKQELKDILKGGVASGVGTSSDKLSDYFIKKAEQYQPVISIDEGTIVDIVFQEGFSLEDNKDES